MLTTTWSCSMICCKYNVHILRELEPIKFVHYYNNQHAINFSTSYQKIAKSKFGCKLGLQVFHRRIIILIYYNIIYSVGIHHCISCRCCKTYEIPNSA